MFSRDTAAWNLRFLGVDVTELAIYWGLTSDYDACKSVGARTAWMPGPTPRQVKRAGQRHALRMASKSRPCHLGMTWFDRCLYVPASLLGLRFYILLLDLLRNLLLALTWCTVLDSMIATPQYSAFWAASILPWWLSIALVSFGLDYAVAGLYLLHSLYCCPRPVLRSSRRRLRPLLSCRLGTSRARVCCPCFRLSSAAPHGPSVRLPSRGYPWRHQSLLSFF